MPPPTNRRIASTTAASSANDALDIPSLKVVVVGDYGVGKTSLIRQLTQRQFQANSGTTIGVEFKEQRFPNAMLQIWDIAGQQYMSSMTKQYYRWSSAAIVCVDVSKDSTFEVAIDWKRDVMEKVGCAAVATTQGAQARAGSPAAAGSPTKASPPPAASPSDSGAVRECAIPIFLFVNKCDLIGQTSHTEASLHAFAMENGFTQMLMTSAKDFSKVHDAFQHVATFVVESQEAAGLEGTRSAAGSTVNLNALRRSMRPTQERDAAKKKECCK